MLSGLNRLKPGDILPDWNLQGPDGETVSLKRWFDQGPLLLLVLPPFADPDSDPGSGSEDSASARWARNLASTIRDNMKLYRTLRTEVVAILPIKPSDLETFRKAENLPYELLSFQGELEISGKDSKLEKEDEKRAAVVVIQRDGTVHHLQILAGPDDKLDLIGLMMALRA